MEKYENLVDREDRAIPTLNDTLTLEELQERADAEAGAYMESALNFENVGRMLDNIDEGLYGLRPRGTKRLI